jgi:hypothetical protein
MIITGVFGQGKGDIDNLACDGLRLHATTVVVAVHMFKKIELGRDFR